MTHEFVHRYRPSDFADFVGQSAAITMLEKSLEVEELPHAILLSGPRGSGKTSLARILARRLNCHDNDLSEVNVASSRGIDTIRDISEHMHYRPMSGPVRVWILDEVHALLAQAQQAFLKSLEEPPAHCYLMLATTEPKRLIDTLRSRCTPIRLKPLTDSELSRVMKAVCQSENLSISKQVAYKIIQCSDGSAREALVFLEGVCRIDGDEDRLAWIESSDPQRQAIELCRAIFNRASWEKIVKIIDRIGDDPEGLRQMVLAYAGKVLTNKDIRRASLAYIVAEEFKSPFYNRGKVDLIRACFSALHAQIAQ